MRANSERSIAIVDAGLSSEDPVLVVEEAAVANDEAAAVFGADAGAVSIGHFDAVELDAVDLDVGPGDDPERLGLRTAAVGKEPGSAADTADRQAIAVHVATSPR